MESKDESDALLLPGAGPYPSYGIEDSETSDSSAASGIGIEGETLLESVRDIVHHHGKERVWSSALFCVIACFASFTTGIMLSFSSSTVLELDSIYSDGDTNRGVMETSTYASLIGVSRHAGDNLYIVAVLFHALHLSCCSRLVLSVLCLVDRLHGQSQTYWDESLL